MPYCSEYIKVSEYLETLETRVQRMAALDALIDQLILRMADVATGAPAVFTNYELNDGQVIIKANYRSIDQINEGIRALERTKNMYLNRSVGRVSVLIDKHNLR